MSLKYKPVSLSLFGKYYVFCGPNANTGATPWRNDGKQDRIAAIGEGQAWFRHWHDASDRCNSQWSGNMSTEYPGLARQLKEMVDSGENLGCAKCVSLGPNGTYFASIGKWVYSSLPSQVKNDVAGKDIDRLFLGRGGNYYALYSNGSSNWRVGNYNNATVLSDWLKKATSPVKAFAFNLVDSSWAVVTEGGASWSCSGEDWTDGDDFDRWRNANI